MDYSQEMYDTVGAELRQIEQETIDRWEDANDDSGRFDD